MPTDTPPPTTYDHKPAYDFARSMRDRAEQIPNNARDCEWASLYWKEWALVEAYMAGRAAALLEAADRYDAWRAAHASPVARGDG